MLSQNGEYVGEEKHYKPGDMLNLTCVSAPSNPPAQLEWTVNRRRVEDQYVVKQHLIDRKKGLYR